MKRMWRSTVLILAISAAQGWAVSGDLDGNGQVGLGDLFIFADAFSSQDSTADLDGDGVVDDRDWDLLRSRYGSTIDDQQSLVAVSRHDSLQGLYLSRPYEQPYLTVDLEQPLATVSWSQDLSMIAGLSSPVYPYVDSAGVVLIDTETGSTRERKLPLNYVLDQAGRGLSWSPDGTKVALCLQDSSGTAGLFSLSIETMELSRIATGERTDTRDPEWTDLGMLFSAVQDSSRDIYLLRPSGEVERVTVDPSDESSPHLSPDGTWLAFASDRLDVPWVSDGFEATPGRDGESEVYVMSLQGEMPAVLVGLPRPRVTGRDIPVGWTPDGRVRIHRVTAERPIGNAAIYIYSALATVGGQTHTITLPVGHLSPTGAMAAPWSEYTEILNRVTGETILKWHEHGNEVFWSPTRRNLQSVP